MKLNIVQRIVLCLGAIGVIIMILFPPTYYIAYSESNQKIFGGYKFIGLFDTEKLFTEEELILAGLKDPEAETNFLLDKYFPLKNDSVKQKEPDIEMEVDKVHTQFTSPISGASVKGSIYNIEPVRLIFQLLGTLIVTGMFLAVFHQSSNSKSTN